MLTYIGKGTNDCCFKVSRLEMEQRCVHLDTSHFSVLVAIELQSCVAGGISSETSAVTLQPQRVIHSSTNTSYNGCQWPPSEAAQWTPWISVEGLGHISLCYYD